MNVSFYMFNAFRHLATFNMFLVEFDLSSVSFIIRAFVTFSVTKKPKRKAKMIKMLSLSIQVTFIHVLHSTNSMTDALAKQGVECLFTFCCFSYVICISCGRYNSCILIFGPSWCSSVGFFNSFNNEYCC